MRSNLILLCFLTLMFIGCNKSIIYTSIPPQINTVFSESVPVDIKNWHYKDILIDTIPGISLYRAYDSLLLNNKPQKVIVAIIDMEIDLSHLQLKNNIWINKDEVDGNEIDDDKNGYIDDINGWNFLGNANQENNLFVNYEYTRILKKFTTKFKDKTLIEIASKDSINYRIYTLALQYHGERIQFAIEDTTYATMISKNVYESKKVIDSYFKNDTYSINELDSLKKEYPTNSELQTNILKRSNFIKYGFTTGYVDDYKLKAFSRIEKLLNLEYNDRAIQGDDITNIDDTHYGNNQLNKNIDLFDHGTKMAGIISNIGLKDEIEIMPLSISAYGDEHDKDIALAIRYAVNNGAKVINMSFAKEFSMNYKWVAAAITYAETKDVLIVHAASNDGINLDTEPSLIFPNDHGYFTDLEISNNFLTVGASGSSLNEKLKLSFSNYGSREVDIFSPGENIYTYLPHQKFTNEAGGTSSATAITSGVAALLFSYYPKLKAQEVKEIIMASGLEYNIDVLTPTEKDKDTTTPFNKVSKSGKIINAYNALLMASDF